MADEKAEKFRLEGNRHFGAKDYDSAIDDYTSALKLHQDHRYYSNRSACYAGKEDWGAAKDDALECIKLSPGFIKGYYRLVTAHMNLGQFDEALQVAKSGLAVDSNNPELLKMVRMVKSKKAAKSERDKRHSAIRKGGKIDEKEVLALQDELKRTKLEMNSLEQYINNSQKEAKMATLTRDEIEKQPDDCKMYLGFGKAFRKTTKSEAIDTTMSTVARFEKKEKDFLKKYDYLKTKANEQMGNFKELVGTGA